MLQGFRGDRLAAALLLVSMPLLCQGENASQPTDYDGRPVCKAEIQGRMRPDIANHDRKLIAGLLRGGELSICVRGTWHYHWEAASVTVTQLSKRSKSKEPSGCEVLPQAGNKAVPPDPAPASGN
ncbi:MAG TPA: hypothetical protein VME17_11665 [Bryobacteraceae bacterium]|nr:hypothetical protein [Bryobacteraceae bacterium]